MTTPLNTIRTVISGLDETIVRALLERRRFRQNLHLYRVDPRDTSQAARLRAQYVENIVPLLCAEGRDDEARKCIALDTTLLDAVARRLHIATLVAARKLDEEPARVAALARGGHEAIEAAVVRPSVEATVLRRVETLAAEMQGRADPTQDPSAAAGLMAALYRTWILPLSREVQREYLLRRILLSGHGAVPPAHPATGAPEGAGTV